MNEKNLMNQLMEEAQSARRRNEKSRSFGQNSNAVALKTQIN